MPRQKVDYRAARAVLSAPYPLPVIITRSRAAASAPPPSAIPLTEPEPLDHHSIVEIIPDPPPTPTTGGLAAQHGFPYNSKWKTIPPAFPPIPYPPRADRAEGSKGVLKLKKKHQDKDESEAMSGIEEGTSGETGTLHEIGGIKDVAMPVVPPSFPGLLSSAFEVNLVSGFVSQTPSPPEGVVDKGKAPIRTAPPEAPAMTVGSAQIDTPIMAPPPVAMNGVPGIFKPSPISAPLTATAFTPVPGFSVPAASLDRAWSPTSVSSNIRSWSAGLEADEEDASNLSESPDTQRLITPAESKEIRRLPKFFGETNLAPFTYDPLGFESEATSQRTITRIPRSKYKRANPHGSTSALPSRVEPSTPPRQIKRRRQGSTTPTPEDSSRQAFLGDRSTTPTQAHPFPSIHAPVPSRGTVSDLTNPRFFDVPPSLPSPVPMSIDPRSADILRQDPSWPSSVDHVNNMYAPARVQYPNTYPPHQIPHYVTPYRPARHQQLQDLRLPGVPSHRPALLPIAKASHRLLLQRKVEEAKRRRMVEEHNRRLFEAAQRDGRMLVTSSRRRDPHDFAAIYTALEPEELEMDQLAHGGIGRKRRLAEVSDSTWEDPRGQSSRHVAPFLSPGHTYEEDDDMFDEGMFDMELEEPVLRIHSPPRFTRTSPAPRVHFGSSSAHQLPPHLSTPRPILPGKLSSLSPRGDLRQLTIHERMEDEDEEHNELSAFNLMVAQAASQRTLKQHEKDARRAEWIRENRERLTIARGRRAGESGPSRTREKDVSMGRGMSRGARDVSMGAEHTRHRGASRGR